MLQSTDPTYNPMPTTLSGINKINDYLKANDISITSLATTLGLGKMYLSEILSGKKTNPSANKLVLGIIEMFKIR